MATEPTTPTTVNVSAGASLPAVASPSVAADVLPGSAPKAVAAAPAAAPAANANETYTVVIKAPEGKNMLAYLVGPGAEIVLKGIDLNTAVLANEAGNLRISLPSGAEILLLDYASAAQNTATVVVTDSGRMPAQKLLAALDASDKDLNAIETAAGPAAGGGNDGGLLAPTILGTGVGSGEGIFSAVIDPYALPRPTDAIADTVTPELAPSSEILPPPPPAAPNLPPFARNDVFSGVQGKPVQMAANQLLANDTDPNGDALRIVSVQGATNGVAVLNPDGSVTFTTATGFTGTGSYSYTVTDGKGGFSTADVTVQIDPDRPNENNVIAADDAVTVPEAGRAITVNVLANDSDPEGDALVPGSVRILQGPDRGTATVNANGTIGYQSVDSQTGYFTTLVYEVSDARGARDTATLTIEVKPALNTLEAIDDSGEIIPAGDVKTFNVVANDIDPQGDAFTITRIVTPPTRGTATFDAAAGTITYDSDESATGYTETIVYEITDARGATDTATLSVRVEPTNNVVAADDTADLIAGQDVRIAVLNNDSDPQGDSFRVTRILEQPRLDDGTLRGSVAINPDGTITYTDTTGARDSAIVEFKYEVEDARGAKDMGVVRVTIGTAPNGVDANNDTFTLAEDSPRTDITANLLGNDFDPQGDSFGISAVGTLPAAQGVLELAGGRVFFTPAANYNGPVTFTYTLTDSKGATDTAQVTINVQEVQDGLNAGDDAFTTDFNTNLTMTPTQLLANDFDPDGSVLNGASIISFSQPLNGSLSRDGNGNFVYNPTDTFRGTDSFTYTIRDGQGELDTATVRIRVADPVSQDNPVDAVNDSLTLAPGETKTLNVLTNDSAPDGGLQFVRVVGTLPAGVTALGNGVFSYAAPANTTGQDLSFQYEVRDADGDTDIATATFSVRGPVNSVDARDDSATLVRSAANTAVDTLVINVKSNDVDPDGDTFQVTRIVSGPAVGSATLNPDGTIRYTADASQREAYSTTLVYEVTDARGATDTATVTINVGTDFNNVDAVNDTLSLAEDSPRTDITASLRANDSDAQGDSFAITAITQPAAGGTVELVGGNVFFTPTANYNGPVSFSYTVTDSKGATDTATVSLNVTPVEDAVDARDDAATTREAQNRAGDPVTINVLANDVNSFTGAIELVSNTQPANGTLVRNTDNTFTYTPNAGFDGVDSFTYTVRNADGATDTATVRITVTPNTVTAGSDTLSLAEDSPRTDITASLRANDSDAQGDTFAITAITQPAAGGTVELVGGNVFFTPTANYNGPVSFSYTITDSRGATSTATASLTVTPVVDAVDARDDTATTREAQNRAGDPVTINVLANDVNSFTGAIEVIGNTAAANGTVVRNANGTFTYTPKAGFDGVDSFTYTVRNADGATDTATVRITVTPNTVTANNDMVNLVRGQNIVSTNVLANDTDAQGDSFAISRIVSVQAPQSIATATFSGNTITFNEGRNTGTSNGVATVVYEIIDSRGATSQATLTVQIAASPLVIDLDGDGVNVTALANSHAHFDLDMDGVAERTAWFGARDGILARDANGNGTIDNLAELYGTARGDSDGFADLRNQADTNHDMVVDANDAGWSQLRLWVDANSDGISQADELRTLDEMGVKAIYVNAVEQSTIYEDAYMPLTSHVDMADGSSRTIGDVFFTNAATGTMLGTNGNDVMVYSSTADTIDGGQGFDTLKLMTASNIVVGHDVTLKGIDAIDLHNNGADTLNLNMADVLNLNEGHILAIRGDAVDEVRLSGDIASTSTVEQNGTTFTAYTNTAGAQVLVESGVHVVTDEIRTA